MTALGRQVSAMAVRFGSIAAIHDRRPTPPIAPIRIRMQSLLFDAGNLPPSTGSAKTQAIASQRNIGWLSPKSAACGEHVFVGRLSTTRYGVVFNTALMGMAIAFTRPIQISVVDVHQLAFFGPLPA